MTNYLIEIRFQGNTKEEIKKLISKIDAKFNLGYFRKKRKVPHISLVGKFSTNNEVRLIRDFKKICADHVFTSYKVKGFGCFKDNRVVFINIKPHANLENLRWNLSQRLQPYCNLRPFDYEEKFDFHATLALDLDKEMFKRIKKYVSTLDEPEFKQFVVRVTLLKNSRILREYDFLQNRTMNQEQAKSKEGWRRSEKLLQQFFKGQYNPDMRKLK